MGKNKEKELIQLTKFGDYSAISKILNKPKYQRNGSRRLNLNYLDEDGLCILHHAARFGHVQLIQLLLERGAHADLGDSRGYRAVHHASVNGHLNVVVALARCNANINAPANDGVTALHIAAYMGKLDMVKLLCEGCAACVTACTNQLKTPFDIACELGQYEVVHYLLAYAAVQKLLTGTRTGTGASDLELFKLLVARKLTPMHYAARGGHVDVLTLLLKQQGVNINSATARGTALHEAAGAGHYHVVKFLCEHGADVTIRNELGLSALDVAHKIVVQVADLQKVNQLRCIIQLLTNEDFAKTLGRHNSARRSNRKEGHSTMRRAVQRAHTIASSNRSCMAPALHRSQQTLQHPGSFNSNCLASQEQPGSCTSLMVGPTYGEAASRQCFVGASKGNLQEARVDHSSERSQSVDYIPDATSAACSCQQYPTATIRSSSKTRRTRKDARTLSQIDCSAMPNGNALTALAGQPPMTARNAMSSVNLHMVGHKDNRLPNNQLIACATPSLNASTNTLIGPSECLSSTRAPVQTLAPNLNVIVRQVKLPDQMTTEREREADSANCTLKRPQRDENATLVRNSANGKIGNASPNAVNVPMNTVAFTNNAAAANSGQTQTQTYALAACASVPVMSTQVSATSATSDNSTSSGFSSGTASSAPNQNHTPLTTTPPMTASVYEPAAMGTLTRQAGAQTKGSAMLLDVGQLLERGTADSDVLYMWLCEQNLQQYFEKLSSAGFDWSTLTTINLEDLKRLGITDEKHIRSLREMLRNVQFHGFDPLSKIYDGVTWPQKDAAGGMSISNWLRVLGPQYEDYNHLLLQQGYCTVQQMMKDDFMTEEDLIAFGIDKPGHARKLSMALSRLRQKLMPQNAAQKRFSNPGLLTFSAFSSEPSRSRSLYCPPVSNESAATSTGTGAMKTFGKKDDFPEVSNLLNNLTALSAIPPNRYERTATAPEKRFDEINVTNACKALIPAEVPHARNLAQPLTTPKPIRSDMDRSGTLQKNENKKFSCYTGQPDRSTLNTNSLGLPMRAVAGPGPLQPEPRSILTAKQAQKPPTLATQLSQTESTRYGTFADDVILRKPVTDKSLEQYTIPPPPPPKPLRIPRPTQQTSQSVTANNDQTACTNNYAQTGKSVTVNGNLHESTGFEARSRRPTSDTLQNFVVPRKMTTNRADRPRADDGSDYEMPDDMATKSEMSGAFTRRFVPSSSRPQAANTARYSDTFAAASLSKSYDNKPEQAGYSVATFERKVSSAAAASDGNKMDANDGHFSRVETLARYQTLRQDFCTSEASQAAGNDEEHKKVVRFVDNSANGNNNTLLRNDDVRKNNRLIGGEVTRYSVEFDNLDKVLSGIASELNSILPDNKSASVSKA